MLKQNGKYARRVQVNSGPVGILMCEWSDGSVTIQNAVTGVQTRVPAATTVTPA